MVYSRDINNLNLNYTRRTVFHFSDYTRIWMTETRSAPEKGTHKQLKPPLYACCEHALKENPHRVSLYFASFEVMIFWTSGFQSFRKPSLLTSLLPDTDIVLISSTLSKFGLDSSQTLSPENEKRHLPCRRNNSLTVAQPFSIYIHSDERTKRWEQVKPILPAHFPKLW